MHKTHKITRVLSVMLAIFCVFVFSEAAFGASRAGRGSGSPGLFSMMRVANDARLGQQYFQRGEYQRAIAPFERILAFAVKEGDHELTAEVLSFLGSIHELLGDYTKAKDYHERALAVCMNHLGEGHEITVLSIGALGAFYRTIGDYAKAKEYYERALATSLRLFGEEHEYTSTALNSMGIIYDTFLKDYVKAKEYYERALAVEMKLGEERAETAGVLLNLGGLYISLEDYEKAKDCFEHALAIHMTLYGAEHDYTAASLHNLGAVNYYLGDYAKAENYFGRALIVYIKLFGGEHDDTAASLYSLGDVYKKMNMDDTAVFYQKMAVNITQSIRTKITSLDKDLQKSFLHSKADYYHSLAALLTEQGRIHEAQQVLRMLKEEEYFDFIRRDERNDPRQTTASFLGTEQKQADRFNRIGEQLFALHQEKEALQKSGKDARRLRDTDRKLQALTKDFLSFLAQVDANLKTVGSEQTPEAALASLEKLQEALKTMGNGAALVHTLITPTHVWLILTTPDAPPKPIRSEISQKELFGKIMALRESLERPERNPLPPAKELYNILLAPMAEDLKRAGARTLMFHLDGPLRYVPISALHDGERWVAEKYATAVYTDAARENLQSGRNRTAWEAAALGVTKAYPGFSALPAVRGELESIMRVNSGIIRMDQDFTESSLADSLNRGMPVVHIASHFKLEPGNIGDSFLLLGDGKRLTLERVHGGAFKFGGVEHLTLSACNTASHVDENAGREMEGLGVVAQKQGAKSVMATLWAINDNSTGIFMPRFYALLQKDDMTRAEALRQVQAEFINGNLTGAAMPSAGETRGRRVADQGAGTFSGYSHPYFWAPFILMGNWL